MWQALTAVLDLGIADIMEAAIGVAEAAGLVSAQALAHAKKRLALQLGGGEDQGVDEARGLPCAFFAYKALHNKDTLHINASGNRCRESVDFEILAILRYEASRHHLVVGGW